MGDTDANISTIFARPRPKKEPFDPARAEHAALISAGDAAVEPLAAAIRQAMQAYTEAQDLSHEKSAIYWAVEDCVMILGAIDTPASRVELAKLLNADLPGFSFYTPIMTALGTCKPPYADLLPGIVAAANGPCVAHRRENLGELCRLAHAMGERIPLTPEQTVKMFKDSTGEYALEFIGDYVEGIADWPGGLRSAFFWFFGVKVENSRGIADARPYYAASLSANPSPDAAAWSKFPGEKTSPATAATLTRAYPLPAVATARSEVAASTTAGSASAAPAAWYPDPVGRHEYRYWDGAAWTAHVADAGETLLDALQPETPAVMTVDSAFASLLDDDHAVRRQAIGALAQSGYQDPEEPRTFQDLDDPASWDHETLARDVRTHPDFDIAYVRAAYPTARSEDHANAEVSILLEGALRCRRKGLVLARLSSYSTWSGERLRALDFGTAAVLLGDPSEGPGDMVQVLQLLAELFARVGLAGDAQLAERVQARFSLGPTEAAAVEKAAAALASEYPDDAAWAAAIVRDKLSSVLARAR